MTRLSIKIVHRTNCNTIEAKAGLWSQVVHLSLALLHLMKIQKCLLNKIIKNKGFFEEEPFQNYNISEVPETPKSRNNHNIKNLSLTTPQASRIRPQHEVYNGKMVRKMNIRPNSNMSPNICQFTTTNKKVINNLYSNMTNRAQDQMQLQASMRQSYPSRDNPKIDLPN